MANKPSEQSLLDNPAGQMESDWGEGEVLRAGEKGYKVALTEPQEKWTLFSGASITSEGPRGTHTKEKKKNQWLNWKSHELQAHISLSGPGFCSLSNCPFQFWIKTPQTPRHGRRYSRSNIKDERKKKGSLTWSISLSAFLPFFYFQTIFPGFPGGTSDKETTCQCRRHKRRGFDPWVRKIPLKRAWQPIAVFLPRESSGQRSVAGYGPWGSQRAWQHTRTSSSHPLFFGKL